jgi:very-short-patch-repair endonuclease
MPRERRDVIVGQFVTEEKRQFARQLSREMTPAERLLWAALRNRKLAGFKFRRQQVIDGFIADFYCADVGLVIELDGSVHDDQAEYDANRDRVLAERRLTILRIPNGHIETELVRVLTDIEGACRRLRG